MNIENKKRILRRFAAISEAIEYLERDLKTDRWDSPNVESLLDGSLVGKVAELAALVAQQKALSQQ